MMGYTHDWKRAYGLGGLAMEAIAAGFTDDEVLELVRLHHPRAKTGPASMNGYRSFLAAVGLLPRTGPTRAHEVSVTLCREILAGRTDEEAVAEVRRLFPTAVTGRNSARGYRSHIRCAGFDFHDAEGRYVDGDGTEDLEEAA